MHDQPTAAAIAVKNLSKSFNGKFAVNNIELNVNQGEIFGFLGPNGGGKTTTMRMLCGLLIPDSCKGHCLGFDIVREPARIKERVGYMTQSFSLYEELTIRENLDFMAHLYQIKNRKNLITQTVKDLNWHERENQLVKTLSGGWKQRLSLVAAVLHNPQLLLLDEPTAGVDPQARREFWEQINELARRGVTVLVSTHYMDEAERCHRLAYMAHGKILSTGSKNEIIQRSGLLTWEISGEHVTLLTSSIKDVEGVEQVAVLGDTLHVSSKNATLLKQNVLPLIQQKNYQWRQIPPSLETVFVDLVNQYGKQT